jgi:hypothetical protein
MPTSRRWKRVFLLGTATITLGVILWAAYLFTAIWLRVRFARELAKGAESLPVITVMDVDSGERDDARVLPWDNALWDSVTIGHGALDRLEALQRPNVATVVRHLLARGRDESSPDLARVQSLVFSSQVQAFVAIGSDSTARVWDVQTGTPQSGSISVNVTASPGAVTSGQTLATFVVWDPTANVQCFSVTDSHGEKVLIATRPLPQEPGDEPTTGITPPREYLLIDTAGRIFARRPCPGDGLVGKLAEPHGKADQLVFGTRTYVVGNNRTVNQSVRGPGVVCIVEQGELKTVRSIPAPAPPRNETPNDVLRQNQ